MRPEPLGIGGIVVAGVGIVAGGAVVEAGTTGPLPFFFSLSLHSVKILKTSSFIFSLNLAASFSMALVNFFNIPFNSK
jgi:hypothetical protein